MSALDGPEAGGNVAKRAVNQIMSLSKSLDYSGSENVRVYIWYNSKNIKTQPVFFSWVGENGLEAYTNQTSKTSGKWGCKYN